MKPLKIIFLTACLIFTSMSQATVKLPAIFCDNMVIQQNKPIHIWGWADKGETVEVNFLNQKLKTKADKNGKWVVTFPAQKYGGPYLLEVTGKTNDLTIENVLIGEVWLCSGQSNMEFEVKKVKNADIEIARSYYPEIRSFNVTDNTATTPLNDLKGKWQICSPETVSDFSAVAYFFAQNLYKSLGVPIGIINSSWGGTDIETWISDDAFSQLPSTFSKRYQGQEKIDDINQFLKENNAKKNSFYHAMKEEPGISEKWNDVSTNISSWQTMQLPQFWEQTIGEANGVVWFCCDVTLPKEAAGETGVIELGQIDDNESTWINGSLVGKSNGSTTDRLYAISKNILHEGKNRIAVKVLDYYGDGGFGGDAKDMYLQVHGKKYPLSGEWHYKPSVTDQEYHYTEPFPNMQPSLLFNAMIHPITQLSIAGVIWYQGENNASMAYNYKTLFPSLIKDWRNQWKTDFPFYWVQLANYLAKDSIPTESAWAELRQAQNLTLSLPNTGQAVITDIGDANDIHPKNKQDVGKRLALIALKKTYDKSNLVCSGPTFRSITIDGSKAIISFDNIAKGLITNNKYGYIQGFSIAGKDKKFVWAKAYIDANNKVVIYSDKVKRPISVRYAWANNPDINLFNSEGLPAVSFQTDDWKWSTQ